MQTTMCMSKTHKAGLVTQVYTAQVTPLPPPLTPLR